MILTSVFKLKELIVLNWQDYVSYDVIEEFEKKYNVVVRTLPAISNEQMYNDILNRKANYDIVIPSDYTIDKLMQTNLLKVIDKSKLSNYNDDIFIDSLNNLMNENKNLMNYYIPYFWGSLGIMYSTRRISNIKEIVETNGFDIFFKKGLLPSNAKVGMYDSSKDSFAIASIVNGYSLNTKNKDELIKDMELFKNSGIDYEWKTDELKIDVANGNLDVALVYSGDFFDAFYIDYENNPDNLKNYSLYVPTNHNNVFYDGMVIPITSKQTDLAHEFINFFLDKNNNLQNVLDVGYTPVLKSSYDTIINDPEYSYISKVPGYSPVGIINKEVYVYLGKEHDKFLEDLFLKIRT